MPKPALFPLNLESERTISLTVSEINALTRRGVWSRLGFSAFVAAIACSVISWHLATAWLGAVLIWELVVRRAIELWTAPLCPDDRSERALGKLAAVHGFGAALYAGIAALGFLSHTSLGAQIAMGWIAGSAIHTFVYFSNRRPLLLANLAAPLLVALIAPTLAAGFTWQALFSTLLTLTLVASAGVFAADRNVLLVHLSQQIHARHAAEEASTAKTQFLRTISHELRTPLNAVIGYSELLEEDLSDMGADQQRADASQIGAAGRHLLTLINDIVHMSQQAANAPLLELDAIDMAKVLSEIEVMARALAAERGNRFVLEAAPIEGVVLDQHKLMMCLSKLVSNACKFTDGGLIILRVWPDTERVVFEVTDTGIGMEGEIRARLFEPPAQLEGALNRQSSGAGLGLAVARKNARLMGGDIGVESTPGCGSTFTLWLPLNGHAREAHTRRTAA